MKKTHEIRLIDLFKIGEKCGCPFHFIADDKRGRLSGCRQRSFLGGTNKVAGTYGDDVFLCDNCQKSHGSEVAEWSTGRKAFMERAAREDAHALRVSMETSARHGR